VKRLTIYTIGLLGVTTLIVGLLVAFPSVRYRIFRIAIEAPQIITYLAIRGSVYDQDFKAAMAGLERQMKIAKMLDVKRSTLLPGIVENTEFVIDRARIPAEYAILIPFLTQLAENHPKLHLGQLWLGQALSMVAPEKAIPYLEEAARLLPTDDRAYRFAIEAALAMDKRNVLNSWCKRYKAAQFGGPHAYRYMNIFQGTGIRKLALEISGEDGKSIFVSNEGVQLNARRTYDFLLPKRVSLKQLRLHAGIVDGVRIRFHKLVAHGPGGNLELTPDQMAITPHFGYATAPDTFITTSRDGEMYSLRSTASRLNDIDRIDLELTFERLGLSNLPGCNGFSSK
jgi:hypothetical protein